MSVSSESPRKIKITADSTVDMSPELLERYAVGICPLYVELGGKVYRDVVEIKAADVFESFNKNQQMARSSAVNIEEYQEFFKQYTDQGYDVVHFNISSEFSSCFANARLAAEELGNVWVVDSRNLSTGTALLVIKASEMAAQGLPAKEIAAQCESLCDYVDASFIIDTLDYLHAGGRCSSVARLGANLLKLKPMIQVAAGKMIVAKKYRGKLLNVQLEYTADQLADMDDIDPSRVFLTHTGLPPEDLDAIIHKIKECGQFDEVLVTTAGCVISVHSGPNCYGVLFIRKTPLKPVH